MIYFFPIIAAIIGFIFFKVTLQIILSKNSNSKWSLMKMLSKEKSKVAADIGQYVQNEFLDKAQIKQTIGSPELLMKIKPEVEKHVDVFLKEKLVKKFPMIGMLGGDEILDTIKQTLMNELEIILPSILVNYADGFVDKLQINQLIEQKVSAFPDEQLYHLLMPKLRSIQKGLPLLGAINGFLIGLFSILS